VIDRAPVHVHQVAPAIDAAAQPLFRVGARRLDAEEQFVRRTADQGELAPALLLRRRATVISPINGPPVAHRR
jgi:hypothetical protein